MLDQLFNLVSQYGQETVVENPEVSNEYNQEIMADATKTVASGFQNIMAGGGFQNILDLFKGGGASSNGNSSNGIAGLAKNPIVTMMVGYFMNKLVSKYKMNASSASSVASNLIPGVLNGLISKTNSNDPQNDAFDFNDLIGSLTGGNVSTKESGGGFDFQGLLNQFTGGGGNSSGGNGFDMQDIINKVTKGAQQNNQQQGSGGGGGLMDIIKGFIS